MTEKEARAAQIAVGAHALFLGARRTVPAISLGHPERACQCWQAAPISNLGSAAEAGVCKYIADASTVGRVAWRGRGGAGRRGQACHPPTKSARKFPQGTAGAGLGLQAKAKATRLRLGPEPWPKFWHTPFERGRSASGTANRSFGGVPSCKGRSCAFSFCPHAGYRARFAALRLRRPYRPVNTSSDACGGGQRPHSRAPEI